MPDHTPTYCVWQVPSGELKVSINTNMLHVADSAIQQRTDITKCVISTQLEDNGAEQQNNHTRTVTHNQVLN